MHVGLVGGGPAANAVRDATTPVATSVTAIDAAAVANVDLAIVVGPTGDDAFETANERAQTSDTAWLAVELGGVGGLPVDIEAAVSGFTAGHGCFECLRARVAASADSDTGRTPQVSEADARFAGALAGREAVRLIDGEASAILGGVLEVPHAQRRFLPVPGCECASSRDATLRRTHEPRSLEEALAAGEAALDERVGPVRQVGEVESFPTPYYLAELADTAGFSDVQASRNAAGVATDWDAAFMKALGEALERYAAGVYRVASFERGPADLPAVPPASFVTAPDSEASGPDDSLPWVPGERLATAEAVELPAEFVHFPPPETRYRPAITTGLGLGNGGVEALLAGLYEVLERDAAMLAWYSTFEPLGLAVDAERYRELAKRARSESLKATALLLTQDVDVPVVAACVHRDSGPWPRFAVGMSADLDPSAAAADALAEALQSWLELRGMGREEARSEPGAVDSYAEFPPAAREFVDPATTVPAASVGPSSTPEGETELEAVVDRAVDAGLEPCAARLTTRDLETLGFEAVRVVVPTAQPLFTDEPYFGQRAEEVPRELGFEPRLDRDHHPFP
ncbi:YcaO-like family protein [Halosegnis sp.]|uniref:YcaO-like family protein n=1 Tax=Halosegnis sp. TaxID=2864959 RepID=UPI0035D4F6C0